MEFYASIRKAHNLPDTLKLETLGGNVGLVTSKTERYLTSLFDILGDSYWKDIEVIQFIDENVEISDLTNECISCLSSKVSENCV
jgi:ABC-type microcin C transport system permease subunit YejB